MVNNGENFLSKLLFDALSTSEISKNKQFVENIIGYLGKSDVKKFEKTDIPYYTKSLVLQKGVEYDSKRNLNYIQLDAEMQNCILCMVIVLAVPDWIKQLQLSIRVYFDRTGKLMDASWVISGEEIVSFDEYHKHYLADLENKTKIKRN